MRPRFDTSKEPCVPVYGDGFTKELSLRDALVRAHEFRGVRHELPTIEFGLYRLLVALMGDIFFVEPGVPLNTRRLGELLARGCFEAARVDDYFAKYPCFDLFDEGKPFLQVGGMQGEEKPLANLLHLVPSGTNVNHFHHATEDEFAVSPKAALWLLATVAPFMTAGGAGLSPSINGAPPIYVLVRGKSLFETLCLNLYASPLEFARTSKDAPAWRWTRDVGGERSDAGYLESLTWMPRRLQLTPGAGGVCALTGRASETLVHSMKFVAGDSTRFTWIDPNAGYRLTDKGPLILRMRKERELWRDTAALALLEQSGEVKRPRVVNQFATLTADGYLEAGKALQLDLYGLRTDMKMKIFEWQSETLALPVALVLGSSKEAGFGLEAQGWLEKADSAANSLKRAIQSVYPREGKSNKNAFGARVSYSERQFWQALRPEFEDLLVQLAVLSIGVFAEREPLRATWRKTVEKEARRAFELATKDLEADARVLERVTRARRLLDFGLKRVFDPPPPDGKKADKPGKKKGAKAE